MKQEFIIKSINISDKKGIAKHTVQCATIKQNVGIVEDAHKGMKYRQVSILSREEIDNFRADLIDGSFGENFTTQGLELSDLQLMDTIMIGHIQFQVSKIGKKCHDKCHIYHSVGDCIMPKKGTFLKVIKGGGKISSGDKAYFIPKKYKVAVVTLSDRAYKNEYEDVSGKIVQKHLVDYFDSINRSAQIDRILIPDTKLKLLNVLIKLTFKKYDLVITTGGTGIGPKDITIDVMKPFLKKELSGITEYIRNKYGSNNPKALISRSIAGVRKKTLFFSLPGSVKGVHEYMAEITPLFSHLFCMINDVDDH